MATYLNFTPLNQEWFPLTEYSRALAEGLLIQPQHQLYLNSGVILIPGGLKDFVRSWESTTEKIHTLFKTIPKIGWDEHQLDQASFAIAVAQWPHNFEELSLAYNYRPPLTWIGFLPTDQVRIFHLTAMRAPNMDHNYQQHLDAFFAERIFQGIDQLQNTLPGEYARSNAYELHEKMSTLIRHYRLNQIWSTIH